MRWLSLTTLILSLAACQHENPGQKPTTAPPTNVGARTQATSTLASATADERLSVEARIVLEKYCGACHIGTYETSLPSALAIFDLAEDDWSKGMTEAQFESTHGRLTGEELPGGAPNDAHKSDRDLIRHFVDREIATLRSLRAADTSKDGA